MGTPAVTTRGMREPEMEKIAGWIAEVLDHLGDAATEQRVAPRSRRVRRAISPLRAPPGGCGSSAGWRSRGPLVEVREAPARDSRPNPRVPLN